MITIDIDPTVFHLGFYELRWYGIMVVLAVIAIIGISWREAKRVGLPEDHIFSLAVWAIISGVVFSRVIHIIDQWEYYMENPSQILNFEGLGVYGAVIGIVLAVVVYCLVRKLSVWQLGDIIAPGALVGMAIGRIGCVINGCCYGLPTTVPWAVIYTNPNSYAPLGIPLHPTQIYHILWNMAAFGVIWSLRRRLKPVGSLFLLYLALYATGDLIVRFFREGTPFLFGIQQAQLIGIIILLVTVPTLVIRMRRAKRRGNDVPEIDDTTEPQKSPE
ncbi:MAG: prolipoprotein diacylglyceryl transferase [Dehalococcoidia bacterium]